MATHRKEIHGTLIPDTSGNVFWEPSSVKLTNDLFPSPVLIFKDTATKIKANGSFIVPKNYVGSPAIIIVWGANNTAGSADAVFETAYRAIANAESLDPTTAQETVSGSTTCSTTAWNRNDTTLNLTAGNFAVDDIVEWSLARDGTSGTEDLAQDPAVFAVLFEYVDA